MPASTEIYSKDRLSVYNFKKVIFLPKRSSVVFRLDILNQKLLQQKQHHDTEKSKKLTIFFCGMTSLWNKSVANIKKDDTDQLEKTVIFLAQEVWLYTRKI